MNKAGLPVSAAGDLSTCAVCQGLGDSKSPRGFTSERAPDDGVRQSGRYVYTYLHHMNITALLNSSVSGCGTCTMISDSLRIASPVEFEKVIAESPFARPGKISSLNPKAHVAWSDEDPLTAIKLAELAKREDLYTADDLDIQSHGRIIIQSYSNEKADGLRVRKSVSCALTSTRLYGSLSHFNSPCKSDSNQSMNEFPDI